MSAPTWAADSLLSLDTCDALGLTGIRLSSDDNCLQISGEVYYEFFWGDYRNTNDIGSQPLQTMNSFPGNYAGIMGANGTTDWQTYNDARLRVSGTSASDFGPATAFVEIRGFHDLGMLDGVPDYDVRVMEFSQAYVSIGDQTVLTAGKVNSIANLDDDRAFGWLGTILSDDFDRIWKIGEAEGVIFDNAAFGTFRRLGVHAIQVKSDLGNGVRTGVALEAIEGDPLGLGGFEGNAVGVVSYESETITAHATIVAADVLDGTFEHLAIHTGATATLEHFKVRAALAANNAGWWNGMFSGEATFDLFFLAGAVDANSERQWSAVGSAHFNATEALVLQAALRFYDSDTAVADDEAVEVRARAEYALSETLTLATDVGHLWVGAGAINGSQSVTDGNIEAVWFPGVGVEAKVGAGANTLGAYKGYMTMLKYFE